MEISTQERQLFLTLLRLEGTRSLQKLFEDLGHSRALPIDGLQAIGIL